MPKTICIMLEVPYSFLLEKIEANKDLAQFKPIILEDDLNYQKAMFLAISRQYNFGIQIYLLKLQLYQDLSSFI